MKLLNQPLFWLICVLFVGCSGPESRQTSNERQETIKSSMSAADVLARSRDAYRQTATYQDRGKIYLSYRLEDHYIREEQPWSVRWQRDQGCELAFFNAEICHDGKLLSCFVYDNETANLDQQQLLARLPVNEALSRVLQDPIARHYVGGNRELPLVVDPETLPPPVVSPVWGWLTGREIWPLFESPDSLRRLDDALVEGQACAHLQLQRGDMVCDLWVDQTNWLVRQFTLPVQLLDSRVRQSSAVSEIEFFVRLHEATFDSQGAQTGFLIQVPPDAKPQQQFVAIPQPFPCHAVGQSVRCELLQDLRGQFLSANEWQGSVTVVIRLTNEYADSPLALTPEFFQHVRDRQVRWGVVLADEQLNEVRREPSAGQARLASWHGRYPVAGESWSDPVSQWAIASGISREPTALVVDKSGNIQYAVSINDSRWVEKMEGAVTRVLAGENIASEMVSDYQNYLTRYQEKLSLVRFVSAPSSDLIAAAAPTPLIWRDRWELSTLKRPGNIYQQPGEHRSFFVVDGWQTIVEISAEGELERRIQLELPATVAIDSLRWNQASNGGNGWDKVALFSRWGQDLFLFDSDWKLQQAIAAPQGALGIKDCCFVRVDSGQVSLWANFAGLGLCEYESREKQWRVEVPGEVEAFAISANQMWWAIKGQTYCRKLPGGSAELLSRTLPAGFRWIGAIGNFNSTVPQWLNSGVSTMGQWSIHQEGEATESAPPMSIGSQLFDESIEYLQFSGGHGDRGTIAAGLNRKGELHLWRFAGDYLGFVDLGRDVRGWSVSQDGQRLLLTFSQGESVIQREIAGQ